MVSEGTLVGIYGEDGRHPGNEWTEHVYMDVRLHTCVHLLNMILVQTLVLEKKCTNGTAPADSQ